ncbi:MAG TPA: hypothetical protein VHU87_01325 [Rhizomicrobium sp.]|jgi:hypothetical protein|nr:hypothetical protein [Rhizomicrobium sp.]
MALFESVIAAPPMVKALVALQGFVVLFIALHDWVPLGRLNDVKAVQAADSRVRLVSVTLLSTLPFAIGLAATAWYADTRFPGWLNWWLWISYGTALYGLLRAWWIPYLLVPNPVRAARYRTMFGRTITFLPERNGISPNVLHVTLHIVIVAIAVLLILRMN